VKTSNQSLANKERPFWVVISLLDNIGPKRFSQIVSYFGSAKSAWQASDREWKELNWESKIIQGFLSFRKKFDPYRYLRQLVNDYRPLIWPIIKLDRYYPRNLLTVDDAPPVLYGRGKMVSDLVTVEKGFKSWRNFWSSLVLAIVGTRKATAYGRWVTKSLGEDLAHEGLVIVSGLALGIDTLAHQSALAVSGKTVAVLGSGVDIVYPASNRYLYQQVLSCGIIFSELPPGTRPLPGYFPARNRIIAGLSAGVLVIEGGVKSGSLITASLAANQGREVLAIPGNINSPFSLGTNFLIKNGAKLVVEPNDVLEEFGLTLRKKEASFDFDTLSDEEKMVVKLLTDRDSTADEIGSSLNIAASKVGIVLTALEIKGLVVNLGLGKWGRK
jgi:DNA processing protein